MSGQAVFCKGFKRLIGLLESIAKLPVLGVFKFLPLFSQDPGWNGVGSIKGQLLNATRKSRGVSISVLRDCEGRVMYDKQRYERFNQGIACQKNQRRSN